MKEPWLVLRGKVKPKTEWLEGKADIDSLVQRDYMGSSEFEWGAVPKSFKAFVADQDKYERTKTVIDGKHIHILCKTEDKKDVIDFIGRLAKTQHRVDLVKLKERTEFNEHFKEPLSHEEYGYREKDFWWDIENHFIFSFNKQAVMRFRDRLKEVEHVES